MNLNSQYILMNILLVWFITLAFVWKTGIKSAVIFFSEQTEKQHFDRLQ